MNLALRRTMTSGDNRHGIILSDLNGVLFMARHGHRCKPPLAAGATPDLAEIGIFRAVDALYEDVTF